MTKPGEGFILAVICFVVGVWLVGLPQQLHHGHARATCDAFQACVED